MTPTASTIGWGTLFVGVIKLALEREAPLPSVEPDLRNASSNIDDERDREFLDESAYMFEEVESRLVDLASSASFFHIPRVYQASFIISS